LERASDHLLAVANWDSRAIDLYTSNGKALSDVGCKFEHRSRWQDATADKGDWQPDKIFGAYQAINFVADVGGKLFLLGFDTPGSNDVVDLFAVDTGLAANKQLRKLARKALKLQADNHFRFAGGAWIADGRLMIVSSPRDFSGETLLNLARPK